MTRRLLKVLLTLVCTLWVALYRLFLVCGLFVFVAMLAKWWLDSKFFVHILLSTMIALVVGAVGMWLWYAYVEGKEVSERWLEWHDRRKN